MACWEWVEVWSWPACWSCWSSLPACWPLTGSPSEEAGGVSSVSREERREPLCPSSPRKTGWDRQNWSQWWPLRVTGRETWLSLRKVTNYNLYSQQGPESRRVSRCSLQKLHLISKYCCRPRVLANYSSYQTETSLAGLKITSTVPDLPANKDTEWFV